MGISGLLTLLKSIQSNKHLSEFSGQTLAVDAYVWLHRGVFTCAPELATGKKTTRYVEYVLHRLRLLQYHHIQPYVVFDGGPLPAKKDTENQRKRTREGNLARANDLAAQGKTKQAREYYSKCVDVTPQMAYQLIKALRAESIPYVVAPYEADAQLAYLEKTGLVDGIITEDSDLLVFGCRNVLFKLDAVASTVVLISRSNFASVACSENSFSLLGWSDAQFRRMAMLSGCDYLESIGGVGLKTAWLLLKKHRTVENVVKVLRREGKKNIPKGYLEEFFLAEKVFLHQRVYNPLEERLVHLTEVTAAEPWNEQIEAYIGADIEPQLAKGLASGDVDPISLVPIIDTNPEYIPCALKMKGKAKANPVPAREGLLNYFNRLPRETVQSSPKRLYCSQPARTTATAGHESGKRTLTDVMQHDLDKKRKRLEKRQCSSPHTMQSRFFTNHATRTPRSDAPPLDRRSRTPRGGPSDSGEESTKENVQPLDRDEAISLTANVREPTDPVIQEDGYISPPPFFELGEETDTPDFSSPVPPRHDRNGGDDGDFGADHVSSPPTARRNHKAPWHIQSRTRRDRSPGESGEVVLVQATPSRTHTQRQVGCSVYPESDIRTSGPDLRDVFTDKFSSEIDCFDDGKVEKELDDYGAEDQHYPTPGEIHQTSPAVNGFSDAMIDRVDDEAQSAVTVESSRSSAVAIGWAEKWAFSGQRKTLWK